MDTQNCHNSDQKKEKLRHLKKQKQKQRKTPDKTKMSSHWEGTATHPGGMEWQAQIKIKTAAKLTENISPKAVLQL